VARRETWDKSIECLVTRVLSTIHPCHCFLPTPSPTALGRSPPHLPHTRCVTRALLTLAAITLVQCGFPLTITVMLALLPTWCPILCIIESTGLLKDVKEYYLPYIMNTSELDTRLKLSSNHVQYHTFFRNFSNFYDTNFFYASTVCGCRAPDLPVHPDFGPPIRDQNG
jgi:hypothetical protein